MGQPYRVKREATLPTEKNKEISFSESKRILLWLNYPAKTRLHGVVVWGFKKKKKKQYQRWSTRSNSTVWPLPYACALRYSRWVYEQTNPRIEDPLRSCESCLAVSRRIKSLRKIFFNRTRKKLNSSSVFGQILILLGLANNVIVSNRENI